MRRVSVCGGALTCVGVVATAMAVLAASVAVAAPTLVWTNGTGNGLWNTADANWVGPSNYVDGYNVFFRPLYDTRNPKTIYIGPDAVTPVPVSPGTSQFSVASYPGGNWVVSGGGIQGGGSVFIGWDANVVFTNYGADDLTFTNGTIIDSGWLAYCPTSPGVYHFGTGPIIASQRGLYVGLRFAPTVAGCTLVNDFIVPSTGSGAPIGGAYWYGTINGAKVLGTITMNGPLRLVAVAGPAASNRLDAAVILTGDRTIEPSGGTLFGPIDGGGTNALAISQSGNSDTWTDSAMYVADDTNMPVWNISRFTKLDTGNTVFRSYRDLGSAIALRTGAIVLGGLAAATNLIRDTAAVNLQGARSCCAGMPRTARAKRSARSTCSGATTRSASARRTTPPTRWPRPPP